MSLIAAFSTAPLPFRVKRSGRQKQCVPRARMHLPDVSQSTPSAYDDGPMARFFIAVLRKAMQKTNNWKSPRNGYDGFVEECRMGLVQNGAIGQQEMVMKTLNSIVPPKGKKMFSENFADPRLNAYITTMVFSWLVGPCSVNRPEIGGWGVKIEKCRFLEESGCKGLCVNMCQQPTQRFFTDELGLPTRMTPDYDDMSCQMTFGVAPLPLHEDPAISGDCMVGCKMSGISKMREATCYVTKDS